MLNERSRVVLNLANPDDLVVPLHTAPAPPPPSATRAR
jgi:hypothetical protein